jgi:hypothetical protein
MTVTFPIVALADGETADPQWFSDITEAVNDHQDAVDELGQLTTSQTAYSFSPSSSVGTTPTAILTIASCVLTAGRAYSAENVGGVYADADGRYADFSLWKTSTSGTQLGAFYRTRCSTVGKQVNCYGKLYIARTAATDLTITLVLSVASDAGTVIHDAGAGIRPRSLVVTDVGPAANWPQAIVVT